MAFSGKIKVEDVIFEFKNLEQLIRQLKFSNKLEIFLDELDKITGRVR